MLIKCKLSNEILLELLEFGIRFAWNWKMYVIQSGADVLHTLFLLLRAIMI